MDPYGSGIWSRSWPNIALHWPSCRWVSQNLDFKAECGQDPCDGTAPVPARATLFSPHLDHSLSFSPFFFISPFHSWLFSLFLLPSNGKTEETQPGALPAASPTFPGADPGLAGSCLQPQLNAEHRIPLWTTLYSSSVLQFTVINSLLIWYTDCTRSTMKGTIAQRLSSTRVWIRNRNFPCN